MELLSNKFEELNPQDKAALKSKYEHSSILIKFNREALKHNKISSILNIFNFLKNIENAHDDVKPYYFSEGEFADVVDWICITNKNQYLNGPSFDISTANSYGEPIIECIAKNFEKKYSRKNPLNS